MIPYGKNKSKVRNEIFSHKTLFWRKFLKIDQAYQIFDETDSKSILMKMKLRIKKFYSTFLIYFCT